MWMRERMEWELDELMERRADAEDERDDAVAALAKLQARIDAWEDLLLDLREYFDQRADADLDHTGYTPNEEMRMLCAINEAFKT